MESEYFDYSCNVNNEKFEHRLKIIEKFVEHIAICPICGAENCGGPEDKFIWAEFEDEKLAIHFGDGKFEEYLSFWHYEGITEDNYKALPNFINEFNEGRGWDGDELNPNSVIDAVDFKKSMDVIKNSMYVNENDEFSTSFYPKIMEFVERVIKGNKVLNILKY
ncbi:hypothetical protein GCM10022289_22980 [Pedobacter jeongneungensis]|uniref:DUF4303 domain-containing protein n=1 Tax=Pedobacter jeongneungensis TaxID=947309 RepID=A0ABP8BFH8_9SPHI